MVGEKDVQQISPLFQGVIAASREIDPRNHTLAALCHYIIVILSAKTIYKKC